MKKGERKVLQYGERECVINREKEGYQKEGKKRRT